MTEPLELGAFSVSLNVADLKKSEAFYNKLGFTATGGSHEANYLIMVNGTTIIGLFQGMFEWNILTFNPGLTNDQQVLEDFTDVRDIQAKLDEYGFEMTERADPNSDGPAHIVLLDPDNNPILIDQHFPRPGTEPAAE